MRIQILSCQQVFSTHQNVYSMPTHPAWAAAFVLMFQMMLFQLTVYLRRTLLAALLQMIRGIPEILVQCLIEPAFSRAFSCCRFLFSIRLICCLLGILVCNLLKRVKVTGGKFLIFLGTYFLLILMIYRFFCSSLLPSENLMQKYSYVPENTFSTFTS